MKRDLIFFVLFINSLHLYSQNDINTYDYVREEYGETVLKPVNIKVYDKFITTKVDEEFSEYALTLNKKWDVGGSYEAKFLDDSGRIIKYWWYPANPKEKQYSISDTKRAYFEIYSKNGNLITYYFLCMKMN